MFVDRELIKLLRQHRNLASKRAFNSGRNAAATILMYIGTLLAGAYLMFLAVVFSLIVNTSTNFTPVECICGLLPFLLTVDFYFRFFGQQTPSQIVKPYLLLPISKYTCIDTFLITSLLSSGNFVWLFFLVPFCIMSVLFVYPFYTTLFLLIFYEVCILANSQWYVIVRTLTLQRFYYFFLPLLILILVAHPVLFEGVDGIETIFREWSLLGKWLEDGNVLPLIGICTLLTILLWLNRKIQYRQVSKEVVQVSDSRLWHIGNISMLERFGNIGQYIQLEILSILRNKNPRKSFLSSMGVVVLLSGIIAISDVYDSYTMTNYWCSYNFAIFGITFLSGIMSYEGNYIDALQVRKENILTLLHAKYMFAGILLMVPLLLMLIPVVMGKWNLSMLVAYYLYTAGFQYFILFQLAVYNKQTMPLNNKIISKDGTETNYWTLLLRIVPLFIPISIISLLNLWLSSSATLVVLALIGLVFILTEPYWMQNVYTRFMQRRYQNIEALRASR